MSDSDFFIACEGRRDFLRQMRGILFSFCSLGTFFSFILSGRNPTIPFMEDNHIQKNAEPGDDFIPEYISLHRSGELKRRGEILWEKMRVCDLCPRECKKRRLDGQRGDCGSTAQLEIASFHPHFGEEPPLVMAGGSGTIFFTHCSLRCVYCINYDISILGQGEPKTIDELAGMMLRLQEIGCENINVVTPTHYVPHIVLALDKAAQKGLHLPLVYNTSGYEKQNTLRLLDGVVDIYLPDFKYFDSSMAAKYSEGAASYPEMAKEALLEMHRQVGVAHPSENGKIFSGLMIRHLVLPNDVSGTEQVMKWIAGHLPKETYVNLMSQYRPTYRAAQYNPIALGLTKRE